MPNSEFLKKADNKTDTKDNKKDITVKRGRTIFGLLLVVLAVFLYCYRTGVFSGMTGKQKTTAEVFSDAVIELSSPLSSGILTYYEQLAENGGTKTFDMVTTVSGSVPETFELLSLVLGTDEFNLNTSLNADGNVVLSLNDAEIYEKEVFKYTDNTKFGILKYVKQKKISEYLKKYEKIFIYELTSECNFMRNDNFINNICDVIMVETEILFSLNKADVKRAAEFTINEAKSDKELKLAYEAVSRNTGSYEEFLENINDYFEEKDYCIFGISEITGKAYINEKYGLTMFDGSVCLNNTEKEENTKIYLKTGYTRLNNDLGFITKIYSDTETVADISGNGIYNSKSIKLNLKGSGRIKETEISFTVTELQFVSIDGFGAIGDICIKTDAVLIDTELTCKNNYELIETIYDYNDGKTGKIKTEIKG